MRTKKNPEIPMVPKAHLKNVEHQRDQYKEELHHCKAELESYQTNLKQRKEALEYTRDEVKKYKEERDTLKDDLSSYEAKISRLEREIKEFDKDYEMVTNNCIYWEDKAHWLEGESSKCINLLSEFSQHIGNKPSSSTYKYFRAKLDNLGIGEDE